jgi:hypothetical protein
MMYSGPLAKVAILISLWVILGPYALPDTPELRAGVLDWLVGVPLGITVGVFAFGRMKPLIERSCLVAHGDFGRLQKTSDYWGVMGIFTILFMASAIPSMLLTFAVCEPLGMKWPWCGAPFVGGIFYWTTLFWCYAKWYDTLPQ